MTDPNEQELSFSRVLSVRAAPPEGAPDLLALARSRALDPSVFDEFAPLFFNGEISSTRWDAYDTRQAPSTLKNFATEAAVGVSILRNHDSGSDPIGQSLTGRFVGGSGDGVARVESDFYLLSDPETAPYARKLRAGVVRDLSVGFYGGQWICSLCSKDMMAWMSRDGCPHMLGMTYTPRDEAGKESGSPQVARATIEDAHLAEYSPVYDGATPGAMLKKARALAAEGRLTDGERSFVQVRYRTNLPERSRTFLGSGLGKERAMPDVTETMTVESGGLRLAANGRLYTPEEIQAHETSARAVRTALDGLKIGGKTPEEGVRVLAEEVTRLRAVETDLLTGRAEGGAETPGEILTRLRAEATDGRAYRKDLIEQALLEGVRAHGNDFKRETYQRVLDGASLEVVKQMHADWAAAAARVNPGGRKTQDGPGEQPAERSGSLPPRAYS